MDTVYRVIAAIASVVQSRKFAASVLAVTSAVIVAIVSVQINAVTVMDGNKRHVILTLDNTPKKVVSTAGVKLNKGDKIVTSKDLSTVSIERASDVQITADGISTMVRMANGTVSDALEKVGVKLDDNDKINVDISQQINDGMDISVDRIAYKDFTETKIQKYVAEIDYTNTISKGRTLVKRAGVNGSKTITYRKTIKNGNVIKTEVIKEVVNQKMVPEIKLVGVSSGKPISSSPYKIKLNHKGQPVNYKRVYNGRATAYSSDRGYAGTMTASGRKAKVGVVAVNPKLIPYGSELYIVSSDGSYAYGYAIAGDTGTALMNGHCLVDLFFEHYEECLKFGAKRLNVYVLN